MHRYIEHTNVGSFLETGIGDETDGSMTELLPVPETVHDYQDILATKLGFDVLPKLSQKLIS
jgi:hypothetical protein